MSASIASRHIALACAGVTRTLAVERGMRVTLGERVVEVVLHPRDADGWRAVGTGAVAGAQEVVAERAGTAWQVGVVLDMHAAFGVQVIVETAGVQRRHAWRKVAQEDQRLRIFVHQLPVG